MGRYVARIGEIINAYELQMDRLKERVYLQDTGIDGMALLRRGMKKQRGTLLTRLLTEDWHEYGGCGVLTNRLIT